MLLINSVFASIDSLVAFAKIRSQIGLYNGKVTTANQRLITACTHRLKLRPDLGATIIFTRDTGHHTSGWWKSPEYERCHHLSISFVGLPGGVPLPFDKARAEEIAKAFFGPHVSWCWVEPPYSEEGKARDVYHYRLFCDAGWQPILPKGEVYSRENTPADWKSFSEIHGYKPEPEQAPFLLAASD